MLRNNSIIKPEGFLVIRDAETKEILLEKSNAIHYENLSIALAKSLANRDDGWIDEMVFGNGAANVSGSGAITYLPTNTVGQGASLYNETYSKVVNDLSQNNLNPEKNFITINHKTNTYYTDIQITCTLDFGEPANQLSFDTDTSTEGQYVFDEIGIRAKGDGTNSGLLLTHVIFHPLQKAANRVIEIVYTIRIALV
jgi:hypothetical protein